jgi:ribosomal protein S18 acetylase RimI-like enzyme
MTTKSSVETTTVRTLAPGSRFDRDDQLLRLILEAFEYQRGCVDPPSSAFAETVDSLAVRRQAEWLVVAEEATSNELAGCVFAELKPGECYLSRIAVAKTFRHRGLSSRMIEQASAIAREAGRAWLTLNVRLSLDDNQVIFRRLGFEVYASRSHPGFSEPTYHRMRRPVA